MADTCQISLHSLSLSKASPGDTLELKGKWGSEQDEKIPVINMGGMNQLEVKSWSDSVIVTKIPSHLQSGSYKVGVYCHSLAKGATRSSGFKTLLLEGGGKENPANGENELWQQYWWLPILFLPLLVVLLTRKTDSSVDYRNRHFNDRKK